MAPQVHGLAGPPRYQTELFDQRVGIAGLQSDQGSRRGQNAVENIGSYMGVGGHGQHIGGSGAKYRPNTGAYARDS